MTFPRAIIIAVMAKGLIHYDGDFIGSALIVAVSGLLWAFTADPLPAAIKRGLEEFAREYRE